jgi:predicted metal-dependent hydrolase
MPTIELDGQTVTYTLRRSTRARHLRLTISASEGLVAVVPQRVALYHVTPFLQEKSAWIRKQLEHFRDTPALGPEGALRDGQEVAFRGEAHTVRLVPLPAGARRALVTRMNGVIRLRLHRDDMDRAREILEHWMREQARERIEAELRALAEEHGFAYARVFIRDQQTRWGSCSRRGNLSFSWRLILAPPHVLEYVVAHEFAHLKEWHHGERFWRLVRSLIGDPAPARAWLKEHSGSLRLADAD